MSDLDTEIEGSSAAIRSVATWLRSDLGTSFSDLGDTVAAQRSAARGDWDGEAATAFASRAATLATAADEGARISAAEIHVRGRDLGEGRSDQRLPVALGQ